MILAKVESGKVVNIVSDGELRELYPSTHFPAEIKPEHLEGDFEDWYIVEQDTTVPEHNKSTHRIEFAYRVVDNKVLGAYKKVALSDNEKAEALETKWNEVKYHRVNSLAATDYLMTADVFGSYSSADQAKITAYRQALRDITNQEDPFNLTYPTLGISSIKLAYTMER